MCVNVCVCESEPPREILLPNVEEMSTKIDKSCNGVSGVAVKKHERLPLHNEEKTCVWLPECSYSVTEVIWCVIKIIR